MERLLAAGTEQGWTALKLAAAAGHVVAVQLLIAGPDLKFDQFDNPLCHAIVRTKLTWSGLC